MSDKYKAISNKVKQVTPDMIKQSLQIVIKENK